MSKTKEFMLGAVKWRVVIDNEKMNQGDSLGQTSFTESVIYLADTHKGKSIPKDLIEQTYSKTKKMSKEERQENNKSSHYVSVKISATEYNHFKVDEAVKTYIQQLENALHNEGVKNTLIELYPRLKPKQRR